jgi:hypothetical protein
MLQAGQHLVIYFRFVGANDEPPYRLHGTFVEQDEEYVKVLGTVGDYIGHELVAPKTNIKFIDAGSPPKKPITAGSYVFDINERGRGVAVVDCILPGSEAYPEGKATLSYRTMRVENVPISHLELAS